MGVHIEADLANGDAVAVNADGEISLFAVAALPTASAKGELAYLAESEAADQVVASHGLGAAGVVADDSEVKLGGGDLVDDLDCACVGHVVAFLCRAEVGFEV